MVKSMIHKLDQVGATRSRSSFQYRRLKPKFLSAVAALIAVFFGCNEAIDGSRMQAVKSGGAFNVGVLPQGAILRIFIPVENSRNAALTIASWETSCECLTITPKSLQLEPNSMVYVAATLDFAHDSETIGDFRVSFYGLDESGHRCIADAISVSVVERCKLPAVEDVDDVETNRIINVKPTGQ